MGFERWKFEKLEEDLKCDYGYDKCVPLTEDNKCRACYNADIMFLEYLAKRWVQGWYTYD